MRSLIVIALLSYLSTALPQDKLQTRDDDPSAGDPKQPPKNLVRPPLEPSIYGKGPMPRPPPQCDVFNPSDECVKIVQSAKTRNAFQHDGSCAHEDYLIDAMVNAHSLAHWASQFPYKLGNNHGPIGAKYWMGPDWTDYSDFIRDSFNRAYNHFSKPKYTVTVTCKDAKNWCGRAVESKNIGGYVWADRGWFRFEEYINLCPIFFTTRELTEVEDDISSELGRGFTDHATNVDWLKTSGQAFLHEVMHLTGWDGLPEPIIDEYLYRNNKGPRAYGGKFARSLANYPKERGGGAQRTRTNADSYAILATAWWFWDYTGYFPKAPPGTNDRGPVMLWLGEMDIKNGAESEAAFTTALNAYSSQDPGDGTPPASTPTPTPAPTPSIPNPVCAGTPGPPQKSFLQADAVQAIQTFCSDKGNWGNRIVPPISFGTGLTSSGQHKALGASQSFPINNGADKLWVALNFGTNDCMGFFQFDVGKSDDEKIAHCTTRLRTVLDGCNTDTRQRKFGGDMYDSCRHYHLTARPAGDADPTVAIPPSGQGNFGCKPTDPRSGGPPSCECRYSAMPGNWDLFKLPDSKNCNDVKPGDLLYNN